MSKSAPQGLGRGRVIHSSAQAGARLQRMQTKGGRRAGTSKSRVVVKANYIRTGRAGGSGGRTAAFAAANYMMFRPGEDGEVRRGFDGERHLEPHEVQQRVGEQGHDRNYTYRMVMSPDRNFGDASTEQWASDTLKRLGYDNHIVIAHAGDKGHTPHPHAHALVFVDTRLDRVDFQQLREFGDVKAREMEMRLHHDRHMGQYEWKAQKEDEFRQWREDREQKVQMKSDGVEDLSQRGRDRQPRNEKQVHHQADFEM